MRARSWTRVLTLGVDLITWFLATWLLLACWTVPTVRWCFLRTLVAARWLKPVTFGTVVICGRLNSKPTITATTNNKIIPPQKRSRRRNGCRLDQERVGNGSSSASVWLSVVSAGRWSVGCLLLCATTWVLPSWLAAIAAWISALGMILVSSLPTSCGTKRFSPARLLASTVNKSAAMSSTVA